MKNSNDLEIQNYDCQIPKKWSFFEDEDIQILAWPKSIYRIGINASKFVHFFQ